MSPLQLFYVFAVDLSHQSLISSFWDGQRVIESMLSWILGGNFNVVRFQEERRGKDGNGRDREAFNSLINELAIIDLSLRKRSFTWTKIKDNPCLATLDRVWVSPSWKNLYPLSEVHVISHSRSDHTPLYLSTEESGDRGARTHS